MKYKRTTFTIFLIISLLSCRSIQELYKKEINLIRMIIEKDGYLNDISKNKQYVNVDNMFTDDYFIKNPNYFKKNLRNNYEIYEVRETYTSENGRLCKGLLIEVRQIIGSNIFNTIRFLFIQINYNMKLHAIIFGSYQV